ncbi:NAD(P)-dependent alcohol dehydrogenase [Microbulbifer sp. JSM ZJ756]|uniref:NAD(P)-dependent alcohol dehydrogenase n=1 Tax=Microbulbifer sp. JSM ZJ756 TaxID=3376191 RepID=UPI0037A03C5B
MKSLIIRKYGSPDFLEIHDVIKPIPADDQVLVKVNAVSINDWDWGLLKGAPFIPNRFMAGLIRPNITIGSDIAGVVEAVGSEVSSYKPGDEVYGDLSGCGFGGFAEYVCAPHNAVKPKSQAMSFEQAAAIPQAGMLALQAIVADRQPEPGQSVLVNGAGGGVGSLAIQLLKLQGLEVTGVDSAEKLEAMRLWGFDHVIDYRTTDFTQNGKRYDLIVDAKSDRSPADYERALNPNGAYAAVGGPTLNLLKVALSGLRINRARDKKLRVIALEPNRDLAYFNELFEAGKFRPVIDTEFDFTDVDVRNAFHHFAEAAHKGKIVVRL